MIRSLAALLLFSGHQMAAEIAEKQVIHAGAAFRIVRLAPERVQLVWKDAAGQPYRSFDRVQAEFAKKGKSVKFLMNAGIFEPGGIPSGLHVESAKCLNPLNLEDAPGNFFLKPNGVFRIEAEAGRREAFIGPSEAFPQGAEVETALQSGPLLLIDGKRHPAFKEGSANRLHRNGVGVDAEGRVVFAITGKGQQVNLWDFARLFLALGCKNALFLDGTISQMAVNPQGLVESGQFGAMLIATE
jgi:uncharacterized protein YigE (DUF2233 family)